MLVVCIVSTEDSWESRGLQGDQTCQSWRKSTLNIYWEEWCWSWNSSTLAAWCKEPAHWKRLWCWERWKAGGEGDNKGWVGWMTSPTLWTWVQASFGSWWWIGKPGVLQSIGSQRVGRTRLSNWTEPTEICPQIAKLYWQKQKKKGLVYNLYIKKYEGQAQ